MESVLLVLNDLGYTPSVRTHLGFFLSLFQLLKLSQQTGESMLFIARTARGGPHAYVRVSIQRKTIHHIVCFIDKNPLF